MKKDSLSKKILYWYDNNKRKLPWRSHLSKKQKQYFIIVSEFMLQQTQVTTVIPYFNRFIKNIPDLETLANFDNHKLIKLWEGLGYYSRVRNLKKTAQIVVKHFDKKLPRKYLDLKSLPGIGDYTASAISAIAFNKRIIPLDGNIERVLKRYLYLKKENEINKENLIKKKKIFGYSNRASDYAQALMELGALICKPNNPHCKQCPISNKCIALKKKDFLLTKIKKKNNNKYYLLKVYKDKSKYLLIKNTKFNFLKNFSIFPMQELSKPLSSTDIVNFKMSNMNMNIKIEHKNKVGSLPTSHWIDPKKLKNYTLPTFTKKIVRYLESNK